MSEPLGRRIRRLRRRTIGTLLAPFMMLWAAWRSVQRYFRSFTQTVLRRFGKFEEPDWSKASRQSVVVPPSKIKFAGYFNPLYWIAWLAKFLYAWVMSRPYKNLAPAIPAVAIATLFLVLIFWDNVQGAGWRRNQYRRTMDMAMRTDDQDLARIASLRLIESSPNDSNLRFQNALIEYQRGNEELAQTLIVDLARSKRHGPAAYWALTNVYPIDKIADWGPEEHQAFQSLVEISLAELRDTPLQNAKLLMSQYLVQMGAQADAMKLLGEIASRNPEVNLIGMTIAYQAKNMSTAREFAQKAVDHLEGKLQSEPSTVQHRLDLARALVVLEREQEAVRQLQSGAQLFASSEPEKAQQMQDAIGEVLIEFANRIGRDGTPQDTLLRRLNVINNALRIAPNNVAVTNAVVEIVLECQNDQGNQVRVLRDSLLEGTAPEAVHFIQGTLALLNGQADAARSHLEIAQSTGMNTPGILNNLAMAFLESSDTENLERALEFSNAAVEAMPDHPYLRDTRGRLLLKLKRYAAAIPELEFALRAPELAADVHRQLAEAYDGMGQKDMAEGHRKMSQLPDADNNGAR